MLSAGPNGSHRTDRLGRARGRARRGRTGEGPTRKNISTAVSQAHLLITTPLTIHAAFTMAIGIPTVHT